MNADYVFTTFEFGGHVSPMLAVAARLQAKGRAVVVVSDEATRAEASSFGLDFHAWDTAPNRPDKRVVHEPLRDWEAETPADVVALLLDRLMTGASRAYAADTLRVLDQHPGAVVVSQELLLGCMLAAEARGRRLALLTSNVWPLPTLEEVPPFGPGLSPPKSEQDRWFQGLIRNASRALYDEGLPALNAARQEHGLAPLVRTLDQVAYADLILLSTAAAYDFAPDAGMPKPFVYAGPQACVPNWVASEVDPVAADPRPLVLVSFSTLYQAQEPVLHRIIAALAGLPVRGIVTLGPQLAPEVFQPAPANVRVVESFSHDALMPYLAAMVTHAGHGSAIRPILSGVPLLCMPIGRDQPDNTARIVARGAGLKLEPNAASTDIATALMQIINEPQFGVAVRALSSAIRHEMSLQNDVAVERLEALADHAPERDGRGLASNILA